MIYVVNGFPGSGKTTFEDMVCKIMGEDTFAFKISTIDFVKDVARYCGWDGAKDLHNRKFLSDLKDLLTQWNDIPYKKIKDSVDEIRADCKDHGLNFEKYAIFIDCREPWEISKLCRGLGAKSLLIRRKDDENTQVSNHADAQVLDYTYDIIINNDGDLTDLADKAFTFVDSEHLYKPHKSFQVDYYGQIH